MSKETLKRYVHSSVVTFLTGFLPSLALSLSSLSFAELEKAGAMGGLLVLLRLLVKALYEGIVFLVAWLAGKYGSSKS